MDMKSNIYEFWTMKSSQPVVSACYRERCTGDIGRCCCRCMPTGTGDAAPGRCCTSTAPRGGVPSGI